MSMENDFIQAVQTGDQNKVIQMLAETPALVNAKAGHGVPAVLMALYYQQPAMAELLAGRGGDLDIFSAAGLGKLERIEALLAEDPACANAFAGDGFQPLGLTCFFGQEAAARLLIARGADVNSSSRNPMRVQPLHSAVAGGHQGIVQALLEAGAQPNARQADEYTPLHAAAQNGDIPIVHLLLRFGADPGLKSAKGLSALDFARESNHPQVADEIAKALARSQA